MHSLHTQMNQKKLKIFNEKKTEILKWRQLIIKSNQQ